MPMTFIAHDTNICEDDNIYHYPPKKQTHMVVQCTLPQEDHHESKTFLMSSWCESQLWEIVLEMNNLIEVSFTIGENFIKIIDSLLQQGAFISH